MLLTISGDLQHIHLKHDGKLWSPLLHFILCYFSTFTSSMSSPPPPSLFPLSSLSQQRALLWFPRVPCSRSRSQWILFLPIAAAANQSSSSAPQDTQPITVQHCNDPLTHIHTHIGIPPLTLNITSRLCKDTAECVCVCVCWELEDPLVKPVQTHRRTITTNHTQTHRYNNRFQFGANFLICFF